MKIVVGTDFSRHAQSVARVAFHLAQRTDGSVELVHIIDPASAHIQAPSVDVDALDLKIRQATEAKLVTEVRALAGNGPIPVTTYCAAGDVQEVLLARARAGGADLIVIGAHGRPALERLFLGSVAERIVRYADRPVLIVPPGAEGVGLSSVGNRPLRVMVALDGRRASEGGVAFVRQLRSRTACDITFLRLYWPVEEYRRLGLVGARDLAAPDPGVTTDLERTLRTKVDVLPGDGEIVYAVEPAWGDPASRILFAASEHRADMLIMGSESRHGWARIAHPPVSSQVARLAFDVPVVFVPGPPPDASRSEVPRISTVLAPTDLSLAGNRSVPFAYALIAAHGGVVELCHVHERALPNPPYAYDRQEGMLTAEERARIEGALRALVPIDAERLGIATHVTVIDGGKAAQAIAQAAERFVVDAIVLASHGKGGGMQSPLGAVSQGVVRLARRPVVVVPSAPPVGSNGAEGERTA